MDLVLPWDSNASRFYLYAIAGPVISAQFRAIHRNSANSAHYENSCAQFRTVTRNGIFAEERAHFGSVFSSKKKDFTAQFLNLDFIRYCQFNLFAEQSVLNIKVNNIINDLSIKYSMAAKIVILFSCRPPCSYTYCLNRKHPLQTLLEACFSFLNV